jgi:DHA1 family putative efflux transporter-like MFS transporter
MAHFSISLSAVLKSIPLSVKEYSTVFALNVFCMFATGPAIQTYFIQQAPQSANLVLSLNTSIVHLGLAAGAGTGGAMANAASTVLYHPWMASFVVAIGLSAAVVSFSLGKRRVAGLQERV